MWIDGGSLLLGTRWADIRETRGFGSAMLSWRRDSYADALRRTALLWARKCSSLYLRSRIGLSTVMDIASNAERVLYIVLKVVNTRTLYTILFTGPLLH